MDKFTKYQYVIAGPRWGWGRNAMEEIIWRWIRIVGVIMAAFGTVLGVFLGIWIFQKANIDSNTLGILLPIVLGLLFAWALGSLSVVITYRLSIFILELRQANKEANR